EKHISVAFYFITLDDIGSLDPADAGHSAFIFYALAGGLVNLVESDLGLRFNGRVKLDGNGDERKAQRALPIDAAWLFHMTRNPYLRHTHLSQSYHLVLKSS